MASPARDRLTIARVHESAMGALRPQVRIGDGRFLLLAGEAMQKTRVRPELGRPSRKLPRVAEDDPQAPVHGLNRPPNPYVLIAVAGEAADFRAVLPEGQDGEAAAFVRHFRRADVEKTRTIRQLHHIVDVRGKTDVLVEFLGSLVCGDAWAGSGGRVSRKAAGEQRHQTCSEHERSPLSGEGSW